MKLLEQVKRALGRLTIFPLASALKDEPLGEAALAYPLIGILIAVAGAMVFAIAFYVGLTAWLAAILAALASMSLTGARQERAFASFAGDLEPGGTSIGPIILGALLLLRVGAFAALGAPIVVFEAALAAGAASYAAMVLTMLILPPAVESSDTECDAVAVIWAGVIAVITGLATVGIATTIAVLLAVIVSMLAVNLIGQRRLGGWTGNGLGAVQQVCEIAALLTAVAMIGTSE